MPEKEGLESILEFRRLQPNAKIIAISGGNRIDAKNNLNMAKKLGANHALAKPFSHSELLDAIGQLLAPPAS